MLKSVSIMLAAAVAAWTVAMALHARADDVEVGPKWKIVLTLEGPPGKQELTYGDPLKGPHWFASQEECEKARKGGDKDFAKILALIKAKTVALVKAGKMPPLTVSTECRPDNSV